MRLALLSLITVLIPLLSIAQNASPSRGCAPFEVNFSPPDGGQAFWDFGDGSNSNLASPSHVYTTPGEYEVTFSRSNGGPTIGTVTVNVFESASVTLTIDEPEGCMPHDVNMSADIDLDPSISINEVNWAFGNGSSSSGTSANTSYMQAGTYDISVEVLTSFSTCNTTANFADTITVNALPQVGIITSPNPLQSCVAPLNATLINRSTGVDPLTYNWDFGNGDTSTDENPAPISYNVDGSYRLSLTVTDGNGCENVATRSVSVGPPSPNFDLPDTVCIGETYTIEPLGVGDRYSWAFGPEVNVIQDLGANQIVSFPTAGATTISLAVENFADACVSDTTRNIFVQELIPDAVSDPSYFCTNPYTINYTVNNPDVTVNWEFPQNQGTSNNPSESITYTYDEGGVYGENRANLVRARLTITSPQGCSANALLVDTIDIPNALFMPDNHQGCAPLTVTFSDSIRSNRPVTEVIIDWGDGVVETVANAGPWVHTYTSPGEYEPFLIMENSETCRDTSYSIPIQVGETLALTYTSEVSPACFGDTLVFINTTSDPRIDNVHFQVDGGSSFHCGSNDTLFHIMSDTVSGNEINMTLFVEYNGCLSTVEESFPYESAPLADLGYAIDCETPFDVTFYNRNTRSTVDSLIVMGAAPIAFADTFIITDSLELNLAERGVYQAVIIASDPASPCEQSRDTADFYITVPVAEFELDSLFCGGLPLPLDGSSSQDVNSTCSKGYQWEFDFTRPYTSSSPQTMDVVANGRGDQVVTLIVEDINGCTDYKKDTIRVFSTQLTISASQNRICLPSTVDFSLNVDSDTTVTSYMWQFGTYGTSTEQNPSFTFPNDPSAPNSIEVTVITEDEIGCNGTASFTLQVYRPVSNVTTVPETGAICAGQDIDFTATDFTAEGSNLRFNWDFDNGQTSQNRIQNVTYDDEGIYEVTLNYTEIATGCEADTSLLITVQEPANTDFISDIDGEPFVCVGEIITFTDNSSSSYPYSTTWAVNGQLNPNTSNEIDVNNLPRGTSEVTLTTTTSAGCESTLTREFTLIGPQGGFTFDPGIICEGETVEFQLRDTIEVESWTWDFGNGETATDINPARATYTNLSGTSTPVSLTLRSAGDQCTFVVVDTLRFLDIQADFVTDLGNDFSCDPTVTFIDQSVGAMTWLYDFGNGDTSTDASPTYTFPGPGEYEVTLLVTANDGACSDEITKTITIVDPLEVTVNISPLCPGQPATIEVISSRPAEEILIEPAVLIATADDNIFTTVNLTASQDISVSVTDNLGCTTTVLGETIQVATPFEGMGDTLTVLGGSEVTLAVENPGGVTFEWQDPDAVGCDDCDNPTFIPEETRDYTLVVEGCTTTTVVFRVILADEPVVPNLFTPNGDGSNDEWGPLYPPEITPEVINYQVFNRWGALVFESDDPAEKWIGDINGGGEAPSDVYAYVIRFAYPNGTEFRSSGEVTLMR